MKRQKSDISDLEIMAYLDEELDHEQVILIESTPELMARVQAFRAVGNYLSAAVYRHDCPTAEELLLFAADLLDGEVKARLAVHLEKCDHCQPEVAQLNRVYESAEQLYGTKEEDSWLKNLRDSGRQILEAVLRPRPATAPVLRGARDEYEIFDAGIYQISLVKKPPIIEEMGWSVEGQIFDPEDPFWKTEQMVHLYFEGEIVRKIKVNTYGYFAADDLAAGDYRGEFLIGDAHILFDFSFNNSKKQNGS